MCEGIFIYHFRGAENPTSAEASRETCSHPSEEQLRYLWDTIFKLRKKEQFLARENAYLKAIMTVVYEPAELRLALAKYNEWRETELKAQKII